MTNLKEKEKIKLMKQAINIVESELEKTGYINYISNEDFNSSVIEKYHDLIKKELYNRTNKKKVSA